VGKRDAEGFIYIVGRTNDLIICAGENIYAAEVEHAIEAIAQVSEAAVVGIPDAARGEVAAAFVVLREAGALTAEDLTAALRGRLAPYKIPKKVTLVETLPKTGSGKINKNELKQQFNQ
jgi:acyl-CoA synthetase (AMP-forming)/AMP-acid ligase II